MFGAITARLDAIAVRLSMIYALLDCSPLVRAPHLKAALAIVKYSEDSARFIFGDSLGDETADAILEQLRSHLDGMTRTKIRDYFGRNKLGWSQLATYHELTREFDTAYCVLSFAPEDVRAQYVLDDDDQRQTMLRDLRGVFEVSL